MQNPKISILFFIFVFLSGTTARGQGASLSRFPSTVSQTRVDNASWVNNNHALGVYGLAVPKDQVMLRASIDGHVSKVFFDEGQFVKQGDVVVELECRPATARVKIAKLEAANRGVLENIEAERAVAAASLDRMFKLFKQNAASEQEYNEAELRLDRANAALKIEQEKLAANQARFELAEAELEQFLLRAPFDGQIVQVQAGVGDSVSQTNDLIRIVSLDEYRVDLFLPVEQANKLKVDEQINLQVNAPLNRIVSAKILFCSPLMEAATGTTRVTLAIDNRDLKLPAGFTVSLIESL